MEKGVDSSSEWVIVVVLDVLLHSNSQGVKSCTIWTVVVHLDLIQNVAGVLLTTICNAMRLYHAN